MATLTLTYTGTVTAEGAIKLPKRLRPEVVKAFAGKSIEVHFAGYAITDPPNKTATIGAL